MNVIEYKETIDYVFCVNQQINRLMELYTRIDPREPVHGLRHVYVALRGLIVMSSPFVDEWEHMLDELNASLRTGSKAWIVMDKIITRILSELDKAGLLTRKARLAVGEYSADTEQEDT
ncbi:MAG: hypothetical protein QXM76_01475 [Zestosphaera sp.]